MPKTQVPGQNLMRILAFSVGCFLICGSATAQTTYGAFHGTVKDRSGAVVPGAMVLIRNVDSGAVRRIESNAAGYYAVPHLPPGHYSLSASRTGFATTRVTNVQLLVNQDLEINLTLQVGQVTQQVRVTAVPPPLDTASGTIGQIVGSQQIVNLPLNGRQFTQLVLLSPGVAPWEGGQQGVFIVPIGGGGISASVDGQGGRKNFYTLDGMFNDALFTNSWAISPPPDAIQEFKVQTHIVDPQFGVSSGGNINVVTKTGTSQFHGDIWEFVRNSAFDARSFFDTNLLPFRQNQYGVTAGGPVYIPTPWGTYDGRKARTFVFGYWEGYRSRQSTTQFANFPTQAQLNGDFSSQLTATLIGTDCVGNPIFQGEIFNPYATTPCPSGQGYYRPPFPGNTVPPNMLNRASLAYLHAFYPVPNYGAGSYPNYSASLSTQVNSDELGVKVTHTFGNNDTLYGAVYYAQPDEYVPSPLLIGANTELNDARGVSVGYTHLFSPSLLATLHYGYTYTNFGEFPQPAGLGLMQTINSASLEPVKDGFPFVPEIGIAPAITGTNQFAIPLGPLRNHVLTASLQKVAGNHTLSVGGMFYYYHVFDDGFGFSTSFDQYPSASPGFAGSTGTGLASMLLDLPSGLFGFLGRTSADNRGRWYAGYIGDKWQASKKLNIQIGIRYDYVSPPSFPNNQISGIGPAGVFLISQALPGVVPFPNVRASYFEPEWNGYQPRFGFAYGFNPKTVLRGGFGIFDDDETQRIQEYGDLTSQEWPWAIGISDLGLNQGIPNTFFDKLPSQTLFTYPNTSIPAIGYGEDPNMRIPYTMEWNLGLQREIGFNTTTELDYVGSGSRQVITTSGWNIAAVPGPSPLIDRVPFPRWGQGITMVANWGTGNYDGLLAKIEKRFSDGLSFLGSYTWSHCMDMQSEADNDQMGYFYHRKSDYGPCDFDIRNNFVFSSVWELPVGNGRHFLANARGVLNQVLGGWNTSGILSASTGAPFTLILGEDIANTGQGYQRPELVGNPDPPGFKPTVQEWYNPNAFTVPAPFTYGNVGRNTLRGPGLFDVDFSLFKDFRISEDKRFEFRVDSFNLFNNPNFFDAFGGAAAAGRGSGQSYNCLDCGTAGQILSAGPGREVQFSLKFLW